MLKPIKNEEQYDRALNRVYDLMQMDIEIDSPKSDELEILSILVKEYENEHHPIPSPNPLEVIKFRLDQMGLSEKELGNILGYRYASPKFFPAKEN